MTAAPTTLTDFAQPAPSLERKVGLGSAISLNMLNMIGVGPFITLPLVVAAMGGPQAMLGWVLGALIAMCDGLVWAELGAAMPEAGGSYAFLREIYGRAWRGAADFVPVHLAAGLHRAAVDCFGVHRAGAVCGLSVAGAEHAGVGWRICAWRAWWRRHLCVLRVALLYRNVGTIARMAWVMRPAWC